MKNQKKKVRFFKVRFILCRLFAPLFDFLIVFVITAYFLSTISMVFKVPTLFNKDGPNLLILSVPYLSTFIFFLIFYVILYVKKNKNTLGNRLFGLEVVDNNEKWKVSSKRLMLRFFLQYIIISVLPFIATFLLFFLFLLFLFAFIIFDNFFSDNISMRKAYIDFIITGGNGKFIHILSLIVIFVYIFVSYKLIVSSWKDRSVMDVVCSTRTISTGRKISNIKAFFIHFIFIFLFILLFLIPLFDKFA